jgi:hypothetical protein
MAPFAVDSNHNIEVMYKSIRVLPGSNALKWGVLFSTTLCQIVLKRRLAMRPSLVKASNCLRWIPES